MMSFVGIKNFEALDGTILFAAHQNIEGIAVDAEFCDTAFSPKVATSGSARNGLPHGVLQRERLAVGRTSTSSSPIKTFSVWTS